MSPKQSRYHYNVCILSKLADLIEKCPYLRFGQILFNSTIITSSSEDLDGRPIIDDPFYEESEITWNRLKNNKFVNEQLS